MWSKLKKLFHRDTYALCATVHLKSGKSLNILCDNVTCKRDPSTGGLLEYSFTGSKSGQAYYINIPEIEAITYKKA